MSVNKSSFAAHANCHGWVSSCNPNRYRAKKKSSMLCFPELAWHCLPPPGSPGCACSVRWWQALQCKGHLCPAPTGAPSPLEWGCEHPATETAETPKKTLKQKGLRWKLLFMSLSKQQEFLVEVNYLSLKSWVSSRNQSGRQEQLRTWQHL